MMNDMFYLRRLVDADVILKILNKSKRVKLNDFMKLFRHLDIVTSNGTIPVCTDWYDVDVMTMVSYQIAF